MNQNQKNIAWFISYLRNERLYSDKTVLSYQENIESFLKFLNQVPEDSKDLAKIDAYDVQSYLSFLYDQKYSKNSVAQKVSSLRSFYTFLVKNSVVKTEPFQFVHLKTERNHLPRFFYQDEMNALFQGADSNPNKQLAARDSAILELFYSTGIRVSECVGIRLEDLDMVNQMLLVFGKGNKQRFVPFGNHCKKALNAYLIVRKNIMDKYNQSHKYLFVNHLGRPITPRGIEYILDDVVKRSSLTTNIHPHMLRHTFATAMLNNGADMRSVQELLGHSSLSSTQIYTHVTRTHLMDQYKKYFPRSDSK